MKKYYYYDLNPKYEDIATYDNSLFNFDGEDDNGYYWTDKAQFDWWKEIKKACEDGTFTGDLEDYV